MNCEDALVLISGHLDAANSAEEEAQLQKHMKQCAACRDLLCAFQNADAGLLELKAPVPETLCDAVMQAVRVETGRKKAYHWKRLAVAACLFAAIGVGTSMQPANEFDNVVDMQIAESGVPAETAVYATKAAEPAMRMTSAISIDPQLLAEERAANIVVTQELLPEMEVCSCETLENGTLLYCLDTSDSAVQLSRTHGLLLYQPVDGASASVSYALLLPLE